jgi:hypothetical protein
MVFKRRPRNQKQIAIGRFDTSAKIDAYKTLCSFDQRASFSHGRFKRGFLSWPNIQNR